MLVYLWKSRPGIGRALRVSVTGSFQHIDSLRQALDYHLQRHNVLATNIANVNTPGFKPSDMARVAEPGFAEIFGVALKRTHAMHSSEGLEKLRPTGRVFSDLSAGSSADGNYVSLDRESGKLATNNLRFDVVSAIASAQLRQLSFAAGDGKR